jgi:spore photoproduct lyase
MFERFESACKQTAFLSLDEKTREFLKRQALFHRLTFAQIRHLIAMAVDLQMWGYDTEKLWLEYETFKKAYEELRNAPKKYDKNPQKSLVLKQNRVHAEEKKSIGFGRCPVASPKTRCCNLLTLDAYEGCEYACSYCSIQSFYQDITVDKNFASKLGELKLDKNSIYHIGTGQSSDSLMRGNREGILDALINFAHKNPNVILELKSKSGNISYLLNHEIPRNIICTFSLNPQIVIDNEEHLTASLKKRLEAAEKLAQKGVLTGFHFHPMVWFEGWQEEYRAVADEIMKRFKPENVALISMGTLTFTKPVLKQIRQKAKRTKILQMPLTDAHGKFSYPPHIKKQLFGALYRAFEAWHEEVFFYLCMEEASLWREVFSYEFKDNESLEEAMKRAYMNKIEGLK